MEEDKVPFRESLIDSIIYLSTGGVTSYLLYKELSKYDVPMLLKIYIALLNLIFVGDIGVDVTDEIAYKLGWRNFGQKRRNARRSKKRAVKCNNDLCTFSKFKTQYA